MLNITKFSLCLLFASLTHQVCAQDGDCIHSAAICFQINPLLIKAIILKESGNNPNAVNKNKNGTIDMGIMQINSRHLNTFSRMGITRNELMSNRCTNIFSGSWLLSETIKKNGYSWSSVGNYHSSTPIYHDPYVSDLVAIIVHRKAILDAIKISSSDIDRIQSKFGC